MIKLRSRRGEDFYINEKEVEAIFEREGNTSEIVLTNGRRYESIYSPDKVADIINKALEEDD